MVRAHNRNQRSHMAVLVGPASAREATEQGRVRMIGQSVRLTTIRGIEVGLHYSWFSIFFLITFSLTTRFASEHPH